MYLSLSCYNRIPSAGWLINNRHLFPTVLEAQFKTKVPGDSVTSEPTSHAYMASPPCRLTWQKAGEVSFMRALSPFTRTPPSWPNHFLRAPAPKAIILGIKFQHANLGGIQTFSQDVWSKKHQKLHMLQKQETGTKLKVNSLGWGLWNVVFRKI